MIRAIPVLLVTLLLAACGGRIAEEPELEPAPDPGCAAATVDAWCSLVARGGTNVDPRADRCCPRWIEEEDLPSP